jgi:hypothetical protein
LQKDTIKVDKITWQFSKRIKKIFKTGSTRVEGEVD